MRAYIYDTLNDERLLELRIISSVNGEITAELLDNYIDVDDLKDISYLNTVKIGLDFLNDDKSECIIKGYNYEEAIIKIEIRQESSLAYKRKYMRVNIQDKFKIRIKPKFNTIEVEGVDISFGGMCIRSKTAMTVNTEIILELQTSLNTFYFDGKIVNIRKEEGKRTSLYGVMFTEAKLRETQSDALYSYIIAASKSAINH